MSSSFPAPPADAGWLLRELSDAGILAPGQAGPLLDEFKAVGGGGDAVMLAEFLVRAGLVSAYQAERVLTGEASKLVIGPYQLLEPVGSGSFGTVYRAVGRVDRQRYAVKVLPLRSLWHVLTAKKQVQTFAALPKHPAIVPFVNVDSAGGSHFLAWPFVEGETLDLLIKRVGTLAPADAIRVASELADGLAICHSHGIVHGLLKPSNLMLGPDRRPRILDLGIGAILTENLSEGESMMDTISTANTAMGMMDCAAPETMANPTDRTVAGDIYSFGCVLYYLLTGSFPFPDGNTVDKMIAHQTQTPVPVNARNPLVPAALAEVVETLMRKNPADRPRDMAAVRDALIGSSPEAARRSGAMAAPDTPPPVRPTGRGSDPDSAASEGSTHVSSGSVPLPSQQSAWRSQPVPTLADRDGTEESVNFDMPTDEAKYSGPAPRAPGPSTANPPIPGMSNFPHPVIPSPSRIGLPTEIERKASPLPARASVSAFTPDTPASSAQPPNLGSSQLLWRIARIVCPWIKVRDVVQVSVFGPRRASPGQTTELQVYTHPPSAAASVRTLSRAFQPDTELLGTGYVDRLVIRGTLLTYQLAVENAGLTRSKMALPWVGQTKPLAFQLYVPWECPGGVSDGQLLVAMDGTVVAQLSFPLGILPRGG